MKKIKSSLALVIVCVAFGLANTSNISAKVGKVWWGIGELVSHNKNAGIGTRAAIGAIGIADAAVWGFAVGSVATPIAGAVAGAVAGA